MSSEEPKLPPNLHRLMGRINFERQVFPAAGELKLDWMRELMLGLGNPQLAVPLIHVAGTKGKGTTTRLIAEIAQAAGLRTGTYTSPHLEHFNERICLDGIPASTELIEDALQRLWPEVERVDRIAENQLRRPLTFFDIASALAFCIFSELRPDLVVMETGMGGRLDSTNVCLPVLSVITSISLDHCRQLGNTVEAIAREKAGIIKPGVPVLCGVPASSPAAAVIAQVARLQGSPLLQLGRDFFLEDSELLPGCTRFSARGTRRNRDDWTMKDIELGMLGSHAAHNATLAIAASQSISLSGKTIAESHCREALRTARITGRIEIISRLPLVILDVAHNPAAAAALADTLLRQIPEWHAANPRILLLAISRDKDQAGILQHLLPVADRAICTKFCENPRATDPQVLADLACEVAASAPGNQPPALAIETADSPLDAWNRLRGQLGPDAALCITGSFFLVAELRQAVLEWRRELPECPALPASVLPEAVPAGSGNANSPIVL